MAISQPTRIDVLRELTSPGGTFDYSRCCQILGEDYDNFVRFCDEVRLIPEDIEVIDIAEVVNDEKHGRKVIYGVKLTSGTKMQFET